MYENAYIGQHIVQVGLKPNKGPLNQRMSVSPCTKSLFLVFLYSGRKRFPWRPWPARSPRPAQRGQCGPGRQCDTRSTPTRGRIGLCVSADIIISNNNILIYIRKHIGWITIKSSVIIRVIQLYQFFYVHVLEKCSKIQPHLETVY